MKKGFFYYCVTASLVLHFLLVLFIKLETPEKKKEKEPIAIDILGPLIKDVMTRLPKPDRESRPGTAIPRQAREETAPPARSFRPSFPALPEPAPEPARPMTAQPPSTAPAPDGLPAPAPEREASSPPSPAPSAPGSAPGPGKLTRPTLEDLQRYAKLDRDFEKPRHEEEITLDTDDLMYTSYLQGLKKRIELIWKYPETARRDGYQGDLVMKFSIAKSGRVENIELIKSSGYPVLDDAARQALMDANPFNPLPDQWHKDYFTITGTFMYRLYGLYLR